MAVRTGPPKWGQAAGGISSQVPRLPLREHVLKCAGLCHPVPPSAGPFRLIPNIRAHFSYFLAPPKHRADKFCARPEIPWGP